MGSSNFKSAQKGVESAQKGVVRHFLTLTKPHFGERGSVLES